jgi:hypothetical protein
LSNRLYHTQRWRRRARAQLLDEPLCRACKATGKIVAATTADHIIPCGDEAQAFWQGELQSLCDLCHQAKRQVERHGKPWTPKLGASASGQPLDPHHPWNQR